MKVIANIDEVMFGRSCIRAQGGELRYGHDVVYNDQTNEISILIGDALLGTVSVDMILDMVKVAKE